MLFTKYFVLFLTSDMFWYSKCLDSYLKLYAIKMWCNTCSESFMESIERIKLDACSLGYKYNYMWHCYSRDHWPDSVNILSSQTVNSSRLLVHDFHNPWFDVSHLLTVAFIKYGREIPIACNTRARITNTNAVLNQIDHSLHRFAILDAWIHRIWLTY